MKTKVLAIMAISGMLATGLMATDFSSMSTEDLVAMRGTVSTTERDAFRSEMQSRMSSLTSEERSSLGVGQGSSNSMGMGGSNSGAGGMGMGSGRGRGGRNR